VADDILPATKVCTKCGTEKPATPEFYNATRKARSGLRPACKICVTAAEAIRRQKNPAEGRARGAKWYAENKERRRDASARWYADNKVRVAENRLARIAADPEKARKYWRDWQNNRYRTDIRHRVNACVSPAIRKSIKGEKGGRRWQEIVGYTLEDLLQHLERQFVSGMTWETYGRDWEIDHIRPVASFDLGKGSEEVRACWALSNLRPLCWKANRAKGAKLALLA
jgi:5-methylcytosine-specific restriction endonuclease McrA